MPSVTDRQTDETTVQPATPWPTLRMLGWGVILLVIGIGMIVRSHGAGEVTWVIMSAPILTGCIILVRAILEFV